MWIAVAALSVITLILTGYIAFLQLQLRGINTNLKRRLEEKTRQPVTLALLDRQLNQLVNQINKSLEEEENLRLNILRDEKRFKEMIANISHDLRTPLTAIKGYQQMLSAGELSDDQRKKLEVAQRHAAELEVLIEHFFEYAYLLNNEAKPVPERINLTNLAADCLAAAVPEFEKHQIEVEFNDARPIYTLTDREMTTRILNNLIRNCIQHSSGRVTVSVTAGKDAIIAFSNTVDAPQKIDCSKLFDRFYTSDQARGKGTGLGLSIVKILAERMDGSTGASLEGEWLTIRVSLPLVK